MKLVIFYYHFLTLFLFIGIPISRAQEASQAFGYVKIPSQVSTDRPFSIPFDRPAVYAGTIADISNNTLTLDQADFTPGDFVYTPQTQPNTYFLSVRTGTLQGKTYDILSNGGETVTTDPNHPSNNLQQQGIAIGDRVRILPYWTLGTLFPSGEGVAVSIDPFSPDGLILVRDPSEAGIRRAPSKAYLFLDDGEPTSAAGWYDADDLAAGLKNDVALSREAFYVLRNQGSANLVTQVEGDVPEVSFTTEIGNLVSGQPHDNYVSSPFPVAMSLAQSQLFESGAFAASSDPFTPTDLLLTYDLNNITGLRPAPSKAYLYYQGTGIDGWYDANTLAGPVDSENVFISGGAFIIRKAAATAGTTTWRAPTPYPSPN